MFHLICGVLMMKEAVAVVPEPSWTGVQWIGGYNQLRADFNVPSTASTNATLLVTSLGIFEPYLNGQRVGNSILDPGFSTVYSHRVLYRKYAVTLKVGQTNVLGLRIGTGKYGSFINPVFSDVNNE